MKFGEQTQMKIERVDHKGRGCGQVNGRPACAYFAFPNETVTARLVGRAKGKLKMETDEILEPSPHRIEPACRHAGECGGCKWQMVDYQYQLELKRRLVNDELGAVGLPKIETVIPCPEQYYYRNRMDYAVGWQGEIGLKAPGRWNRYLDVDDCRLLSPETPEIIEAVRQWMRQNQVEPWDNKFHRGYLRYLTIREGKNTGERLIMILTAEGGLPAQEQLTAALRPYCSGLLHGINTRLTDISVAESFTVLHGQAELTEEINGFRFSIPVNSFFQTNSLMAAELVNTVKEMLGPKPVSTLLDLYCGVGFFGICLSGQAERVVGVEMDEQAIAVAERNAAANRVPQATFQAAAAESLVWEKERPEVAVIDPPRAGLHPKVIDTLLRQKPPRLIYVSCNYRSLARDWKSLSAAYRCTELRSLDLFPHSPHVETVALLENAG